MQLKSFSARNTAAVLALIKEHLGPDAVILDTQEEDGAITMTCALERPPSSRLAESYGESDEEALSSRGFEPIGGRTARFQAPPRAAHIVAPARGREERTPAAARERERKAQAAPSARSVQAEHSARSRQTEHSARSRQAEQPARSRQADQSARSGQADQSARSMQETRQARLPGVTPAQDPIRPAKSQPQSQTYTPMPPGWQQWHDEWSSIKNHLMALMKPALRLDLLPPRQRLAIEFLQREGVEDAAVLDLYQQLQDDPGASILDPLARMVPVRTWSEEDWPQRIQLIAGPFGAGKTSVAIRMAISLRRTSPDCRICLVNADATRGNGRLLLRHYCDLSEMAYKEASTTMELVSALNTALREGYDRIIVDLPGLSRGRFLGTLLADAGLGERTGESEDDTAVHLTLPPLYGTLQLSGILERYRTPHAGSIVWTKLDEAEHYGQLVNVAVHTGLPVSALSFGPGLGNSLAPVRENMLWRLLFKRELPVVP